MQIQGKPTIRLKLTCNSLVPTDQTLASYGAQEAVDSFMLGTKRRTDIYLKRTIYTIWKAIIRIDRVMASVTPFCISEKNVQAIFSVIFWREGQEVSPNYWYLLKNYTHFISELTDISVTDVVKMAVIVLTSGFK